MSYSVSKLSLTVWRVEHTCSFVLNWGEGTQLQAELKLFPNLMDYYGIWQQAYLQFYRSDLRARVKTAGSFPTPPVDWRVRLAQAEANLLNEFHRWLASQELLKIRQQIAQVAMQQESLQQPIDLFLNCDHDELARLPWETWEIGQEFGRAGSVRLSRTPSNIQAETVTARHQSKRRRGKLRLLAILGDDTGLDFQRDLEALRSLRSLIEIEWVGWQQGKEIPALREEIAAAIADPQGWDVLFFAGHSNESQLTGGELAIAPNTTILLSEIAPKLAEAKLHGLKFALFNSCNGLSLAKALISLGLSQVAVMREPIHNAVAQEFLIAFVQALANYEDVHQAMRSACNFLQLKRNLTFPSAGLVPSLFQHPGAVPFRLTRLDWRARLRRWWPTRGEAMAVGALAGLSVMLPVQHTLIEQRSWVQAQFRQLTGQVHESLTSASTASTASPPVLLVQIDSESVRDVVPVRPLNRSYLAQLINQAQKVGVTRLGLDYVLDRASAPADDTALNEALAQAQQAGMQTIVAVHWEKHRLQLPHQRFTSLGDEQLGDIQLFGSEQQAALHARIDSAVGETQIFPFSQMLIDTQTPVSPARPQVQTPWLTQFSYLFYQTWLHPLIDYSLPPERIYQVVSAKDFLEMTAAAPQLAQLDQQIVLIAAGYSDAGVTAEREDNKKTPRALRVWSKPPPELLNGGEVHAYHMHHWLYQAFITPLPDLWFVVLAAGLGKGGRLARGWGISQRGRWVILGGVAGLYSLVSLQLYITMQILLPWLLPMLTLSSYGVLMAWQARQKRD